MDWGDSDMRAHDQPGVSLIEGPFVDAVDPFDAESATSDLAGAAAIVAAGLRPADPLVPADGSGPLGLLRSIRFVFGRCAVPLLLIAVVAALPMHFFVGRVDDTVIAAPALSDLAGGFGLLLLPLMWLAYFTVSALPLVIGLAGVVAVALPAAADGVRPGFRVMWRLVADRLRPLWLWFAAFAVAAQALPVLLTAEGLGEAVGAPLMLGFWLLSTAVYAFTGMLGCVVLVERHQGPRRAAYLFGRASTAGLIVSSVVLAVLPPVADMVAGDFASTFTAVAAALLWASASLITYARARATEEPVTSGWLRRDLAVTDLD